MLNDWIENNYNELRKICSSVAKTNNIDDLLQLSIEQLITNARIKDVPDSEKLFFFARIVRNNYNSKTSKYHKVYRSKKFVEYNFNLNIAVEEYEEPTLTIEWVLEEVQKIKNKDWYLGQIFLLYLSRGANLTRLSKEIGIPINNLSRDIKIVKIMLNKLYEQKIK